MDRRYQRTGVSKSWTVGPQDARGRSQSIHPKQRGSSNFVSRIRTRSLSIARGNRKQTQQEESHTELDLTPEPTGKPTPAQIADIVETRQRALMTDMISVMQGHEKEINFWKNKALRNKSTEEAINASHSQEQKLMEKKVSILEKTVASRDILIESLRMIMETQEKTSEKRELQLEDQLEKLVASSNPEILDKKTRLDMNNKKKVNDPAYELSILEELLSRVLAEKDKVLFENQNLMAIMRQMK